MKILLCIGIVLLIIMGAIGIYLVCRIVAYQFLQTQMMVSVNPSILTGETGNGNGSDLDGLHVWEEISNCTLMLQVFFNCPAVLYITDFSNFTEENRLVGLQLFDTRKVPNLKCTDPQIIKNVTFRKISDIGDPEEESHWLWYFSDEERWS